MQNHLPPAEFWNGRRVLLTGHTGFKGSWLALWLTELGAKVSGYALPPPTEPSLFRRARIEAHVDHHEGDIRDLAKLVAVVGDVRPEVIFHLAAQSLVRPSYDDPVETYSVNVMGTVHLLEAVRRVGGVRAVVGVTSDKCYENRDWEWGYRETDPMGGFDPYSSSKGCSELVIASFRNAFFTTDRYQQHGVALASVRAGNVIGGGDWAEHRLVPDIVRAIVSGQRAEIRHPNALRPWQHVLDPLSGYLLLAQLLCGPDGSRFAEGWNFGPVDDDARPVRVLCDRLCDLWGDGAGWTVAGGEHVHEATHLKLDISKARARLGWKPTWTLDRALAEIVAFNRALQAGTDLRIVARTHIAQFEADAATVAAGGRA